MSLGELLRHPPASVRALLDASGVPGELLYGMLDELAAALRAAETPSGARAAPEGHAVRERADAISVLGETLSALALGGEIAATAQEMSAVHAWVRAGLLACIDELSVPATRDVAVRKVLATAEILFIEFDLELRVRWTPDFERPPFDRASVGRRAEEFLDPDDGGQLTGTLRRVLATGVPERAEVTLLPRVPLLAPEEGPLVFLVAVEPMRDARSWGPSAPRRT